MKFLKIIGIFFLICLAIGLLRKCFPKDSASEKKIVKEIAFKDLPENQQRDSVNGFVYHKNYKDRFFLLNENIKDGLRNSVKYPETLEFYYNGDWVDGKSTFVCSSENITQSPDNFKVLTATVDFRSDNSFGVKVRSKFKMTFEFNGNEDYKIISADVIR